MDLALAAGSADSGAAGAVRAARLHLTLEHAGDPAFQRREWRARRTGALVLAAWVGAAALGLSGPGACAKREVAAPDGSFRIAFDKVLHQDAPSRWRVRAPRGIPALAIAGAEGLEVRRLRPDADEATRADGARVLSFRGEPPSEVEVEIVPRRSGWSRAHLELGGEPAARVEQLVLP